MADIFISYSRKDSEQALQLAELLTSAGLSCWIDKQGIELAANWSGEIVDAIDQCKAFVILLSTASAASHNVAKELALASERRKKILPLDLEPIELPREFAYQLAGIQRSPMTNIDSIIRALSRLGLEATGAPIAPKIVKQKDSRKSLMILPFEDLSPTRDNDWFADGLACELINSLSSIRSLRVIDWNTSRLFRDRKIKTVDLACELNVSYFIEGQVRKFGDQIKISIMLLDIENAEHLWQDSLKGTMDDVFEIQERVANQVVDALKLHLTKEEKSQLEETGTSSTEAYELFLRAFQHYQRGTKESDQIALQILSSALDLDPSYASAYRLKADVLVRHFNHYNPDPSLINEAERLAARALEIKPDLWRAYGTVAAIKLAQGELEEAEAAAIHYTHQAPEDPHSHSYLGFLYQQTHRPELAIPHQERALELWPDTLSLYANLVFNYESIGDLERAVQCARAAQPYYERYLRLLPDDFGRLIAYAHLTYSAGYPERATEMLSTILKKEELDGRALYNLACLYARMGMANEAVGALERAFHIGYRGMSGLRSDPDFKEMFDHPAFHELLARIESKANA